MVGSQGRRVGVLVLVALMAAGSAQAQQALDATARKAAVDKAASLLRAQYIFPEKAEEAAKKIETELAAGSYDALSDPPAFAQKLTADLQSVTHDKHMRVMTAGPPMPTPATPGVESRPPPPKDEFGVVRADRLDGNIGYIEVDGFPPANLFKISLDRAMASLKDTKALVIDIRRNGGGSPEGVAYLVSYFVDPQRPMLLNTFMNRKPGTTEFNKTEEMTVKTPTSYRDKPVYVLTSQWTFSGGEEFAYDMQSFKLGTLVGETTGGGANPGGAYPISPTMGLFVPNGRPENAVTHTNWEGVGVKPEIATARDDALKTALQKLGQKPAASTIDALSKASLFAPRTTQQPGSEAMVRQAIDGLRSGQLDYSKMSPGLAETTRQQLPAIQKTLGDLGELQSIKFRGVEQGMDAYDVTFAKGNIIYGLLMGDDGKVLTAAFRRPPPK